MEIRLASLISGATDAVGTTVIIDVFRAFTTAAVALSRGARRIVMVDSLDEALAARNKGIGDIALEKGTASNLQASILATHLPSWHVPRSPARP